MYRFKTVSRAQIAEYNIFDWQLQVLVHTQNILLHLNTLKIEIYLCYKLLLVYFKAKEWIREKMIVPDSYILLLKLILPCRWKRLKNDQLQVSKTVSVLLDSVKLPSAKMVFFCASSNGVWEWVLKGESFHVLLETRPVVRKKSPTSWKMSFWVYHLTSCFYFRIVS